MFTIFPIKCCIRFWYKNSISTIRYEIVNYVNGVYIYIYTENA